MVCALATGGTCYIQKSRIIYPLARVITWWWWWQWLFPCMQRFGENVWHSFPACVFGFFFFFKVEISSHTLIPLFRPGSAHSGSASRDDCDRAFPDELHVSLFPDRFPHYVCTAAWAANFNLIGSKVYARFRCNLPPALLAEWPESFMCYCGNMGWNGHWIRVSTHSWLWRRKFFHHSCWDSNSQPFDHESSALTNKLSQLLWQ